MKRSKPTQKSKIAQVVLEQDGKFKCIASKSCAYMPNTFRPGNFKRHLKSYHPVIFDRLELTLLPSDESESPEPTRKQQKLTVYTNSQKILLGTLQLITTGNSSFSFFDSAAFYTLLQPMYDAAGIKLNRKSIPKLVDDASELARLLIKQEVAKSLVSLKIDSASRGNRHIFAINCQYYANGKIVIRNLAVREMHDRQTKQNLKGVIEEVLKLFEIDEKQVYSIVSGNGQNMVATIKLLRTAIKKGNEVNIPEISMLVGDLEVQSIFQQSANEDDSTDSEDEENIQIDDSKGLDHSNDIDDFSDGKEGDAKVKMSATVNESDENEEILDCTRCAAHTAQLAVWDVIGPYKLRIAQIQKLIIKLRHREYHKFFKTHNAHLPPFANTTSGIPHLSC